MLTFFDLRRCLTTCRLLIALLISLSLTIAPASADPGGKGRGRQGNEDHGRGHQDRGDNDDDRTVIIEQNKVIIQQYYASEFSHGRCPPGLAKKNNGCLPSGQAKKWAVGQPLPRDVVYYPLPPQLVIQLTPPPVGHQYVRVGTDILLIAAGTGLVAAGLSDLLR